MPRNPILEEIYEAREQLVAECKGDLHAYVEDARKRALASGRPIVTPLRDGRVAMPKSTRAIAGR